MAERERGNGTRNLMVLLEKVDDNYPFLEFDHNGKPNVQVPALTTSKEIVIMSSINSLSSPCLNKMGIPVPAESTKRKKKQMIGPASRMKMTNKARQIASEEECIPDKSHTSLQIPLQHSDHKTKDIFDDPELCVSSVKIEEDDDINIEHDEFDNSTSYNLTDRIMFPTSECFHCLPSEEVSDCNQIKLKDLTTKLLELYDKNINLDKKLSELKKEYSAKASQIQHEKKGYELQFKNILRLVQDWRNSSYSKCSGVSQISSDKNSTGRSSSGKDLQQATSRWESTKKSIIKKSLSENRSKNKDCVERPLHTPEPSFVDVDTHSCDFLEFEEPVTLESIDAELVCLSDIYGSKKSRVCVSKTTQENPIKEAFETSRGASNCLEKFTKADVIKKLSAFKPVVQLHDIYANKGDIVQKKVSIGNIKCGSYVIIKLSSKKTFEHYCAVVRSKSERGECFAQYMERKKDNKFIFPEKETTYKIEEGDIVKVLQEPTVKVMGSRVYYTFPDNLVDFEALK